MLHSKYRQKKGCWQDPPTPTLTESEVCPGRRTGPWCFPKLSARINLPLTTSGRKLLCIRQRKLLRESGPVLPLLGTAILPVWAGAIEGFELYLDSHDGSALEGTPAERTVSPFSCGWTETSASLVSCIFLFPRAPVVPTG